MIKANESKYKLALHLPNLLFFFNPRHQWQCIHRKSTLFIILLLSVLSAFDINFYNSDHPRRGAFYYGGVVAADDDLDDDSTSQFFYCTEKEIDYCQNENNQIYDFNIYRCVYIIGRVCVTLVSCFRLWLLTKCTKTPCTFKTCTNTVKYMVIQVRVL